MVIELFDFDGTGRALASACTAADACISVYNGFAVLNFDCADGASALAASAANAVVLVYFSSHDYNLLEFRALVLEIFGSGETAGRFSREKQEKIPY